MIVMRAARDDSDAFRTATGMEVAGVEVFSITFTSDREFNPFIVWGRVKDDFDCSMMDRVITTELEK